MSWSLKADTYVIIDAHIIESSIREEFLNKDRLIMNISNHFSEKVDAFRIGNKLFKMSGNYGEYFLGLFRLKDLSKSISNQGYVLDLTEDAKVEHFSDDHYIEIGTCRIDLVAHEDMENLIEQFNEF